MSRRLDHRRASPEGIKALLGLETYVAKSGLEPRLLELVKLRASQINGCAFCIDMHARDAKKLGETEQRLMTVSAFRETPFFSDRERAALAWTEALTRLADAGAPQALFDDLKAHFSEKEMVDLTLAIGNINAWNRIGVGFGLEPAPASA